MNDKHHRRSIRLQEYDYSQDGAYFVTICAYQRECLFGDVVDGAVQLTEFGRIVDEELARTEHMRPGIILDEYVVMPNHVHLIVLLDQITVRQSMTTTMQASPLAAIIRGFKGSVTNRINTVRGVASIPIWQRNYYEHIIRNEKALNAIRKYILLNPARWAEDKENPVNVKTT